MSRRKSSKISRVFCDNCSWSPSSNRAGLKHLLYPVIQPQLTSYSIEMHGSIFVAMDLVAKRCPKLRKLNLKYRYSFISNFLYL